MRARRDVVRPMPLPRPLFGEEKSVSSVGVWLRSGVVVVAQRLKEWSLLGGA